MPGEPFFRFSFNSNWQIPDNENSQFHLSTLRERGYNVDSIFANLRASEAAPNRGQFTPSRVNSSLRNSKALETVEEPVVASETGTTKKANKKPLAFYLAFLGLNIVVFIVSLDATALSVALPIIARDLHGTTLESFWAGISFLLAVVVTQPIYTSFSDVFGRMIPLYFAFFIFGVGSIVFAIAHDMPIAILGRVLQGLGGGGLDVLGEIIIADITSLKERPLYLGLLAIPMAAGSILGPIIGAVFAEYSSWRWIGWVNLPLVGVGFLLNFFFLRLKRIDQDIRAKLARIDWVGIVMFTLGLTSFILPLSWGGSMYPWKSWQTIFPMLLGLAILVVFGFYEARPVAPIFPYRLFGNRTALVTLLGSFIHGLVVYCLLLYLPIYLQAARTQAPVKASVSAFPLGFTVVIFSALSAIAVEYFRQYRWNIWFGWSLLACGLGLMSLLDRHSSIAAQSGFQVIAGLGIGTLYCVLVIPIQAAAPSADDAGLAVGMLVFFRLFGAVFGLALGSATFNNVFKQRIHALGPLPPSAAPLENSNEALSFIPLLQSLGLTPTTLDSIVDAYVSAIRTIWLVMAGLGALGFLTSLLMKELSLEKEDLGRQQFESGAKKV